MKLFLIYQSEVIGATPNIKYKGSAVIAGSLVVPPRNLSGEFERPELQALPLYFDSALELKNVFRRFAG